MISLQYCVYPSYQRRGIAGLLTKWGLEIASQERVPVTLKATINAEPLYRHIGFRDYSYNCLAEDIDRPALIWEPEGVEGSYGTNFPP
jgi:GNAT superfamily N-acetyltransferase